MGIASSVQSNSVSQSLQGCASSDSTVSTSPGENDQQQELNTTLTRNPTPPVTDRDNFDLTFDQLGVNARNHIREARRQEYEYVVHNIRMPVNNNGVVLYHHTMSMDAYQDAVIAPSEETTEAILYDNCVLGEVQITSRR